ncbi:unnamed protein product, partial [Scytosiphon promiscuus]
PRSVFLALSLIARSCSTLPLVRPSRRMTDRRVPKWLGFGLLFLVRKEECLGFTASPSVQQQRQQQHRQRPCTENHHAQRFSQLHRRPAGATEAAAAAASAATMRIPTRALVAARSPALSSSSSRTALHATGFGPPPPERSRPRASPDPRAYYPNEEEEEEDDDDEEGHHSSSSGGAAAGEGGTDGGDGPFPELSDARKVEEPRGIGTLFESEDEVIRELSSEEYLDLLRDWAPIASFASVEARDAEVKEEASRILTVLRGMAEWQPKRNADYTKLGSKWAFGAPIGAIKGGQVDALACLQVSEDAGVVVEWICGNPVTLGIPGNAVEWLAKGVEALCGKRLDLPVTISAKARGE